MPTSSTSANRTFPTEQIPRKEIAQRVNTDMVQRLSTGVSKPQGSEEGAKEKSPNEKNEGRKPSRRPKNSGTDNGVHQGDKKNGEIQNHG
jgi:hypothetical protein